MTKYNIDFEYMIPEFGTITGIEADDPDEAEELAKAEIVLSYPEALDIIITAVNADG